MINTTSRHDCELFSSSKPITDGELRLGQGEVKEKTAIGKDVPFERGKNQFDTKIR